MVPNQAFSSRPASRQQENRIFVTVLSALIGLVSLFGLLHYNLEANNANRLFGFSLLAPVACFFLYLRIQNAQRKYIAWRKLAARLGLSCRIRGLPPKAIIQGEFRGREIEVSTLRRGPVQVRMTKIMVELRHETQTMLRVWGPLDEEVLSAELARNPNAWCFGRNKTFLLHSNRQQSNHDPFPAKTRARLQRLNVPTNIIVSDGILLFEQTGLILNETELAEKLDLLSEIAFTISEWDIRKG